MLDSVLGGPESVTLIGGAAFVLHHGVPRGTKDIDAMSPPSSRLVLAIQLAGRESGLEIPFQFVSVAEMPEEYEDRLEKLRNSRLTDLTVLVPEAHDLVLSKFIRGDQRDFEAAKELHSREKLDPDILVKRYLDEMSAAIGNRMRLDMHVTAGIETLFGQEIGDAADAAIQSRRESERDGQG